MLQNINPYDRAKSSYNSLENSGACLLMSLQFSLGFALIQCVTPFVSSKNKLSSAMNSAEFPCGEISYSPSVKLTLRNFLEKCLYT